MTARLLRYGGRGRGGRRQRKVRRTTRGTRPKEYRAKIRRPSSPEKASIVRYILQGRTSFSFGGNLNGSCGLDNGHAISKTPPMFGKDEIPPGTSRSSCGSFLGQITCLHVSEGSRRGHLSEVFPLQRLGRY